MLIQSNEEQKQTTDNVCDDSFVCLRYIPATKENDWTWKVVMIVDDVRLADEWWEKETGLARVYYGTGYIRNAK